jgi:hypothetical protein
MRYPKVSMRRWMVAVAAISLVLYGENIRRRIDAGKRRETYQYRAHGYRHQAAVLRDAYEGRNQYVFAYPHGPVFASTRALKLKWAEYYEDLARKYELAASHPWEVAPADPPRPE